MAQLDERVPQLETGMDDHTSLIGEVREDMKAAREETRAEFANVRAEFGNVRVELRAELSDVRG
jgi:hypothetical protein